MHEGAVCTEIMDIVEQAAKQNDLRKVYEIHLAVGPWSCVNEAQLNFYFSMARVGTCMEEAVIFMERDSALQGTRQLYVKNIRGD